MEMNSESHKRLNKTQVLVFRILLVVFVLGIILFFMVRKYYWQPRKYKHDLYNELRTDPGSADLSDEQIRNYAECIYNEMQELYGNVNDFPSVKNPQGVDINYYKAVVKCSACSFYENDEQNEILKNLDSLAVELFLSSK